MSRKLHISLGLFVFLFLWNDSFGQPLPTFNMLFQKDTTVEDCKGILYDNGGPGSTSPQGDYDPLSRDTFRICTGGSITFLIQQFATEPGWDSLYFYDGTSIGPGSLIGVYSGTNVAVPPIVSNSGCLTIVFRSSAITQFNGFKGQWTSTVVPPVPPTFSVDPVPTCSATVIDLKFSQPVQCDSIYPDAIAINGPITTSVTNVSPIGCIGDSTDHFQLTLTNQLDESCDYEVNVTYKMLDNCDSVWIFNIINTFTITDCPIDITFDTDPNDSICIGSCVTISTQINGCLPYNYTWSHGLPSTATVTACPTTTTTYTLGVSTGGGPTFYDSITITIIQPTVNSPVSNPVCQSDPAFNLIGSPPGGTWSGPGIVLPNGPQTGTFDPDTSGPGSHIIEYSIGGICTSTLQIDVSEMDAGNDDAACVGSSPFVLSAWTPAGGTWSGGGGYVSPAGTFTPSAMGTYTVTYTHPNGCSDTKLVNVNSGITLYSGTDTLCESVVIDTLDAQPPGGRWEPALGIIDTVFGAFRPSQADTGLNKFVYKLNGCVDTLRMYIKPSNAGFTSTTRCPLNPQDTFPIPSPTGGVWRSIQVNNSGNSVLIDSINGIYDPNAQGNSGYFDDRIVYYAPNGCTDTVRVYVRRTSIGKDSLFFCLSDNDSIKLNQYSNTQFDPSGGIWSGPGVAKYGSNYYFRPQVIGKGIFTLFYDRDNCFDTVKMVVYPGQLSYDDTTICSTSPTFTLDPNVGVNARWKGPGIVDSRYGGFNPGAAGAGTHSIVYYPKGGCTDTINITVYAFQAAYIGNIDPVYCSVDTNIPPTLTPPGGNFYANGSLIANNFNPDSLGQGNHQLIYTYGEGACITSDTITVDIYPPLQTTLTASKDTICNGGSTTLFVQSQGGNPFINPKNYVWNQGLPPSSGHLLKPTVTTTYIVSTADGCSDDQVDTITVHIYPPLTPSITTSPIGCYGDPGTASLSLSGGGSYSYSWSTSPASTTSSINGISGKSYFVNVTDNQSGCKFDTVVKIPGYALIRSLFSSNPNLACIPYEDREITFLDLSEGATQGQWILGDSTIPFSLGENPKYMFDKPGTYPVKLVVQNEGGCADSITYEICILEPKKIFVPDIFSPNNDGMNDEFLIRGGGISNLNLIIYDRWGKKIFESSQQNLGWDGTINGEPAATGLYIWYLDATFNDGSAITEKGDITLVR